MSRMRFVCLLLISLSAATAFAQNGGQEILFWHHYADERAEFWEALVEEFNETNPYGITVTVQYYPSYNHQHDAILRGLLNAPIPNVALVRGHHAALYQLSGALVDLNLYLEESELGSFYPLILEQDVVNGQRLGLPLTRSFEAMYVNMDLLRDLGYETPPTTRETLAEIACKYAEEQGYTSVGFEIPLSASFLIALNKPHEIYDGQQFDFDLSETVIFLQNLLTKRCASLNIGTFAEAQNRFAAGQTLFYMDSTAAKPYVTDAIASFFAQSFDLVMVPVPSVEGPVANIYGPSLVLFHHNEVQDLASWRFMAWLAEPEQMQRWAAANAALPAREDVTSDFEAAFLQALWFSEPHMAGYDLIRDELVFAVRAILMGGVEVQARLRELNQTANDIQDVFAVE